jgi:hypothetical protein
MTAPPARAELSDVYPVPSNATMRTGMGKLWDYVTGLLGATGNAAEARAALGVGIRSQLAGLTMSTAGSSTTMTIAAGEAADSTNSQVMILAASRAKTTSAWVVGTAVGGLDTGTIANSTWYHFYLIKRVDTGVVDVVFSLSASAPTLPTNYTLYRRIGSGKTNGSGQWTSFIQDGDYFYWITPVVDVSVGNPGITAVSRTLTVPSGVNVAALIQAIVQNTGSGGAVYSYFSDLNTTDIAPTAAFSDTTVVINTVGGVNYASARLSVRTNTSSQIRSRLNYSDALVIIVINTLGFIDRRGRDA